MKLIEFSRLNPIQLNMFYDFVYPFWHFPYTDLLFPVPFLTSFGTYSAVKYRGPSRHVENIEAIEAELEVIS